VSEVAADRSGRWEVKPLSELADAIQYGYTAKARTDAAGIRYLRITDIQDDHVEWSTVPSCDVSDVESEKYLLAAGDLVFARTGATVGKSFLIRGSIPKSVFASYLIRVRLRKHIDPRYVAHFFQSPSYWNQIAESSAGIGQPNVNGTKLAQIQIPVAPPAQQIEIVAELEKQFSRLDEAVANLQRVKANLKRYKASILKAAVEGRLVETEATLARREGRAYETGEQLLQRILDERRAKWAGKGKYKEPVVPVASDLPGFPEGWALATYCQLGEVITGFTPPTGDAANFGGNTPFFKPTDLDAGDSVRVAREYLSAAGLQKGRKLSAGSVLVTCIGATIGKTGLAQVECATNQQINSVSPVDNCVDSRYLFWWTCSPVGQAQIVDNASATTLPILNKSKFEALSVALPPVAEQARIVAEVDRHMSIIREVEAEVDANLHRASALRQSTLRKAFETP
jgi:type I restriction enzyme S subunit